jgi:hypothetical protein
MTEEHREAIGDGSDDDFAAEHDEGHAGMD